MKLVIELVPKSSWYDNVRSAVTDAEWDAIRRAAYARYNHKCGICGGKPKRSLEAHEIWAFDDESQTQTLEGIIALCPQCHKIKHIGLSELLAQQGKLDFNSLVKHFCKVNDCNYDDFIEHRQAAFAIWAERSEVPWTVDITWLEANKAPDARQRNIRSVVRRRTDV